MKCELLSHTSKLSHPVKYTIRIKPSAWSTILFFLLTVILMNANIYKNIVVIGRGVAQPGSALEWGSRGRWFKSSRPDFYLS